MATVGVMREAEPTREWLRTEAMKLFTDYPAVLQALSDFRRERLNGVIELHMSTGGVAKVIAKPTKVYS